MTMTDEPVRASTEAPLLRVSFGDVQTAFVLDRAELNIGRGAANDIRIDSEMVSGVHARLVREQRTYRFVQVGRTNPTYLRGAPITDAVLQHGDRLEIAPGTPNAVTLIFELSFAAIAASMDVTRSFKASDRIAEASGSIALPAQGAVTIGRSPENDLVLTGLTVSRHHARVEIENGAASLVDMDSANGTYVNGIATHMSPLVPGDIFRIGPYKLVYRDGAIEHHDDSRAVRLDVHDVKKSVSGHMLLSGISMNARPGEVLAIAGTSGAGKSTLIDALNGSRPPTSGHILVNGADLYQAYDALRPLIGYVPQETILPLLLTVRRALHYVARLRLPADVGHDEADARIDDVMRRLDLYEWRDVQISRLSGGQQKRASIAAELISSPGLFFLDEPTSGLDPGLTRRVTAILHELAASGRTVVVISHDVEGLASADRIVFLAAGGHVAFIGTPAEALEFFEVDSLAEIYTRVDRDGAQAWSDRHRPIDEEAHALVDLDVGQVGAGRHRPIDDSAPASENPVNAVNGSSTAAGGGIVPSWDPVATISASVRSGTSSWRQFRILTARYAETVFRDRRNMALLLLQAPIIGILLTLVAKSGDLRPQPAAVAAQAAQFGIPAAKLASSLPLMLAASAVWFGAINAAREIVKELPILRRERLAGLRPAPYLASKLAVLMLLCVLQTSSLLAIVALKARISGSGVFTAGFLELWITLNLASFAALGLGLLISASFSNADRAQSLVPIILIPQLIFVGGAGTGVAASWVSYFMITHWAVEAMKISAGIPYTTTGGSFDAAALALRWSIMGAMGVAFSALAGWQVSRSRQG